MMKQDAELIKKILLLIENESDYVMSSHKLMKILGIKSKAAERNFMGQIFLMSDSKLIDSPSSKYPFGFVFGVDGEYTILDVGYRLTSRAYELLDVFKNEEIYEKVKNLSIENILHISKQIINQKVIEGRRKSLFG